MRCSLFIFLLLPMVASGAMVVEDDEPAVVSTIESIIAKKLAESTVKPAPIRSAIQSQVEKEPVIVAVPAGTTPTAPATVISEQLGLTVVREGDGLLLSFGTAPAKLFISNGKTGGSVRAATWLTDKALKVAVPGMERVDIRTERGRFSVALDGARLSAIATPGAEPMSQ
ncbi:hypothetical protein FX016_23025 [Cupriavidus gilardii]|nr:hypothetical protein FX016_23025 [Cupriavidus gilardii]